MVSNNVLAFFCRLIRFYFTTVYTEVHSITLYQLVTDDNAGWLTSAEITSVPLTTHEHSPSSIKHYII